METSFPFIVFHREQQMDGRAGGREEEGQRFMGYLNSSFIQGGPLLHLLLPLHHRRPKQTDGGPTYGPPAAAGRWP